MHAYFFPPVIISHLSVNTLLAILCTGEVRSCRQSWKHTDKIAGNQGLKSTTENCKRFTFTVNLVSSHLVSHGANAAEGAGHVETAEGALVGGGVALVHICTVR